MRTLFGAFTTKVAAFLVLSTVGCAQERAPGQRSESKPDRTPRRLEYVTWNSNKHELSWVISKGERRAEDGTYKPSSTYTYVIHMDKATMTFNGETRSFSKEEAVNVHALLDLVAKYAIESTIWWDQGHGERLDKKSEGTRVAYGPDDAPAVRLTVEDLLLRIQALEKRLELLERDRRQGGSPIRALRAATLQH